MRILALDLAKSTGWAALADENEVTFGTKKFTQTDFGELAFAFRSWLEELIKSYRPELVAYEAPVVKHPHAAKILIGMSWLVILTCRERNISCVSVGNTAVKKHFVGKVYGKSIKPYPGYVEARRRGHETETTDEADAIAILYYVRDHNPLECGSGTTSDRESTRRKRRVS